MSTVLVTICGACQAPYEKVEDSYEGEGFSPSCACDAEGVECEARVSLADSWAAHRIYVESEWPELIAACERKRWAIQQMAPGDYYLAREDGLTYTERDRRKRWQAIADRKAKEAEYRKAAGSGYTSLFSAALKDKFVGPIRDQLHGNQFVIPLHNSAPFRTVTPGQASKMYGLDVVTDDALDETEWYVISGAQLSGYADPARDQYRIPRHALIPEPLTGGLNLGREFDGLRVKVEAGSAIKALQEQDATVLDWNDTAKHHQMHTQLITTPAVQRRYFSFLDRYYRENQMSRITGLGV